MPSSPRFSYRSPSVASSLRLSSSPKMEPSIAQDATLVIQLRDTASTAPSPFLRDAASIALDIVDVAQGAKYNKEPLRRLATDAGELVYAVSLSIDKKDATSGQSADNLKELLRKLSDIERFMRKESSRGRFSVSGTIRSKANRDSIAEYREDLRQTQDLFGLTATLPFKDNISRLESQRSSQDLQRDLYPSDREAAAAVAAAVTPPTVETLEREEESLDVFNLGGLLSEPFPRVATPESLLPSLGRNPEPREETTPKLPPAGPSSNMMRDDAPVSSPVPVPVPVRVQEIIRQAEEPRKRVRPEQTQRKHDKREQDRQERPPTDQQREGRTSERATQQQQQQQPPQPTRGSRSRGVSNPSIRKLWSEHLIKNAFNRVLWAIALFWASSFFWVTGVVWLVTLFWTAVLLGAHRISFFLLSLSNRSVDSSMTAVTKTLRQFETL